MLQRKIWSNEREQSAQAHRIQSESRRVNVCQ